MLKLKIEEEKQLKVILEEKQKEFDNLPEAMEVNEMKIDEYGKTVEENIEFFKKYDKEINEAEDKRDHIINTLRAIALNLKNPKEIEEHKAKLIQTLNKIKTELELTDFSNIETSENELKTKITLLDKELTNSKKILNENIAKASQLLLSGKVEAELISCVTLIQKSNSEITSYEYKLSTLKSVLSDITVISETFKMDKNIDEDFISLMTHIKTLRCEYSNHIQSFIRLIHKFIALGMNPLNGNPMNSQQEFIQNSIEELKIKIAKISEEIKQKEESLNKYNEPLDQDRKSVV